MGRPRKPTNVLSLRGAFKHDPDRGRARQNEPIPDGEIGDPPGRLSEAEVACWREIVDLAHAGTLCRADRLSVECAARMWAEWVERGRDVDPRLRKEFLTLLGRFGMSPSDRSKVSVIKPKENANPFGKFVS